MIQEPGPLEAAPAFVVYGGVRTFFTHIALYPYVG